MSPTEFVVFPTECDREASIIRRPWHTGGGGGCRAMVKQNPLRRFTKRPKHNPLDGYQGMFFWAKATRA